MKVTLLTKEELEYYKTLNDPITITEIYCPTPWIVVGIRMDDDTLVGFMTIFNINPISHKAEFGIHILKLNTFLYRRMYDIVNQFLEESFKRLNLNRICARIHSDNKRSISCAHKLGFVYEGTERQSLLVCDKYKDIMVFSILKSDFERKWQNVKTEG